MEAIEQLKQRYELYQHNGILLDNTELIHFNAHLKPEELSEVHRQFMEDSEKMAQEDLELQFQTLEEAEKNRQSAVEAKNEADLLREEAEHREEKLKVLNEELEEKNKLSEAQLGEERKARHAERTINFQRVLVYVVGSLIGLCLLLSHISGNLNDNSDKLLDLTKDAIILLLQIFGMAASYVFGSQLKGKSESRGMEE